MFKRIGLMTSFVLCLCGLNYCVKQHRNLPDVGKLNTYLSRRTLRVKNSFI